MLKRCLKAVSVLLLIGCFAINSESSSGKFNLVDWPRGVIVSHGSSKIRLDNSGIPVDFNEGTPVSLNSARKFSYDRARDRALENLVLLIKNIQVDSSISFRQLLMDNEAAQSRLSVFIEKKVKLKQFPLDFFTSGCRIEIKMSSLLAALPYRYPGDPIPVIQNNPIPTDYSSLIIDTRKLAIKPMLLPSILNEEGLEIFSRYFINIDRASREGIVKYEFTETDAMNNSSAGNKPYFAAAIKNRNGSPVLSNRDVKKILSSPVTRENLKNCRVIFIIDRE